MKNPNGYGSVVRLSGNRRKPFCARKTIGWNEKGQPVYKAIGYYTNRKEAIIALAEYNRNPYDLDASKITMAELFERWSAITFPKLSKSSVASHKTSFKHASALHNLPYKDIKAHQMQEVIDNCGKGYATQGAIKNFFGQLDDYAFAIDLISKRNSSLIHAAPIEPNNRKPFTKEEISALWERKNEPYVDTALIFLYTGFRLSELLEMKPEQVNLEERYFTGGSKTKAGKDRIVPIHSKIFDLVKRRVEQAEEYLISEKGKKLTPLQYYPYWNAVMGKINAEHTPHECRHTFRSRLDSVGANKVCIDLMMGHKSKEVGERVYTHKSIEELREALELVTE